MYLFIELPVLCILCTVKLPVFTRIARPGRVGYWLSSDGPVLRHPEGRRTQYQCGMPLSLV